MSDIKDAWKNKKVFLKQLEYNLQELSSPERYPNHWKALLLCIEKTNAKSILDIGCGCGAVSEVVRMNCPSVRYVGLDYSSDAIDLAKNTWGSSEFFVKDLMDLTENDVSSYDLLFSSAVFDVMPNGDEALEHVMKICVGSFLLSRPKFTLSESHYTEYIAYDEIQTCAYYHSKNNFVDMCDKYGYTINVIGNDILLVKNDKSI